MSKKHDQKQTGQKDYDVDTKYWGEVLGRLAFSTIIFAGHKGLSIDRIEKLVDKVTDNAFEPIQEIVEFEGVPAVNDTVREDIEEIASAYCEELSAEWVQRLPKNKSRDRTPEAKG